MKIFNFQQVIHHLLSLQKKKNSATAAVIVAFTVPEMKKKNTNLIKLEYISYTMTLDCKKNLNATKGRSFEKKN